MADFVPTQAALTTGEFAFEDAYIKPVTYMNGTQSFTDRIVGKFFFVCI